MLNFCYDPEMEKFILYKTNLMPRDKYPHLYEKIENEKVDTKTVEEVLKSTEKLWSENKDLYFEAICNFFELSKEQLPKFEKITVYLTRLARHPYNIKGQNYWFTVPLMTDQHKRLKTIVHELTHLYFFRIGWGKFMKDKGFSDKTIDDVNETSSTILVNTTFQKFLHNVGEKGHDRNKEYRRYVAKNAKDPDNVTIKELIQLATDFYKVDINKN